jgi:hypothetical protein
MSAFIWWTFIFWIANTCSLSFVFLFNRWCFVWCCYDIFASCCFYSIQAIFEVNVFHQSLKNSTTFL